jgi:hypothetical protein
MAGERGVCQDCLSPLGDGTFFMASEGELAFPDLDVARRAVGAFAATIVRMDLSWDQVRVDVLAEDLATFAADYDELVIDTAGEDTHYEGYVTGLLVRTDEGWRIRQLHWSMPVPD